MKSSISEMIRDRRKFMRLDQKSLARIAGISVHALSDLETGKGNPTLSTVEQVLNALGFTLTATVKEPEAPDA